MHMQLLEGPEVTSQLFIWLTFVFVASFWLLCSSDLAVMRKKNGILEDIKGEFF